MTSPSSTESPLNERDLLSKYVLPPEASDFTPSPSRESPDSIADARRTTPTTERFRSGAGTSSLKLHGRANRDVQILGKPGVTLPRIQYSKSQGKRTDSTLNS